MSTLLDTHYHFDFMSNDSERVKFMDAMVKNQNLIVAQTVLPSEFSRLCSEIALKKSIQPLVSLGFHPWWISSEDQVRAELEIFEASLGMTRFIGEIGLDFAQQRLNQASETVQRDVFCQLLGLICNQLRMETPMEPYVLSIHTVRSASVVLDILETHSQSTPLIIPIFHRFNGTSDELTRLIRMGGYVSIHPQMLSTKRGRAYSRQIPAERILLESDLPDSQTIQDKSGSRLAEEVTELLNHTVHQLSILRQQEMTPIILQNQARLYGKL